MPLNLLTLSTEDGLHSLSCPIGAVLDVGSDAACDIVLDGDDVQSCHCVVSRISEKHFQVTAVAPSAHFTVNDVSASDLRVAVPFKFGIGGETIAFDLADDTGTEVRSNDDKTVIEPSQSVDLSTTARSHRREYLLLPTAVKARSGERVGEVLVGPSPPKASESPPPVSEPVLTNTPPSPLEAQPEADEEESSSLFFAGLLLCGVMIAAIVAWQQHLDGVESQTNRNAQASALRPMHPMTTDEVLLACRDLRLAGAPRPAAHLLRPLAEDGDMAAMHELAEALHESGEHSEELIMLFRQAAEGGVRDALPGWVREIDSEENPARFDESSFKSLQLAAALGEPSVWMPLGERHEVGHGTTRDIPLALAAYQKAQAAGDPRAKAKLSAQDSAQQRVEAFIRSWNEVSVATLLDHVSATPRRFFTLEHPPMDALLRMEEDLRTRWPLRRIRVVAGAKAEMESFDLVKISQPFQFELERGERLARGTGVLICTVQRDAAGAWRVTEATDTIETNELRPAKEKFTSASSLRELKPALASEERIEESHQQLRREMSGIEETQDFKPALTAVLNAAHEFPQEAYWRPFADKLCDRMARQLFAESRWLDAGWAAQVHQLADCGSISAVLLEGHLLAAGYGVPRDEVRSTAMYQRAFEAGKRSDARFYYAEALFQGRGVPQDLPKAEALVLAFMTRSKHPLEAYLAAHLLWRKAEIDPALWQQVYDTLSRVADKLPPAKHLAAMVLLNNGNTTRERKTGFVALKAAAESGVQEAMKNLSKCYQDGIGCKADSQAATLWKQKAAITDPPRRKHYTEWAE